LCNSEKFRYNKEAKKRIRVMKTVKKIHLAIGVLFLSQLVSAVEITEQDRASRIPSISAKEMNDIIVRSNVVDKSAVIVNYEDKLIKTQAKRFDYSLSELLYKLERNHNDSHRKKVYIVTENSDLDVFITAEQKNRLEKQRDIEEFIGKLNAYSNMSFVSSRLCTKDKKNIVYIKNFSLKTVEDQPIVNYTLLEKTSDYYRNNNLVNPSCTVFSQAFDYFRTHQGQTTQDISFNLTAIEVMDLYIKLARWNVNLESVNDKLLALFSNKAQYINNFNFKQAFEDLSKNPSYSVASEVKRNLIVLEESYASDTTEPTKGSFLYEKPTELSAILKELSELADCEYVVDRKYGTNTNIPLPIGRMVTMKNISDLIHYAKNATPYEIKITTNKYIPSAEKQVVVFLQRDKRNQALHYLDNAIIEVVKAQNTSFSKQAFIDDIKSIKKDY
jgi:hypothetical protein